ncbi:hypothetical protein EOD39_21036 [Acipenser ruthenus]|uniref:Uncharacterized protein n=1 Tax=Acipenser ruthenus TaxID=7906 RepID=A0A444UTV0_ACIRT|nr:hypothetical protein EOD39_21036 [Acipenser ruthenus]
MPVSAMGNLLLKCAVTDLAIQWVGWGVASAFKTEKFYDLAGSGTFVLLTLLSRRWGGTGYRRQNVQSGLVTAWGLRRTDMLTHHHPAPGGLQNKNLDDQNKRANFAKRSPTKRAAAVLPTIKPYFLESRNSS